MLGPCRTKQQVSFAGWTVWDRNSSASKVQITYYREILWIPGRFRLRKRNSFIIKPQYESHVFLTSFLIFLFYYFFFYNILASNSSTYKSKMLWIRQCGCVGTQQRQGQGALVRGAPAALSACSMPGAATEALNHDDLLWVTSAQTIPGLAHKPKVQLQLLTTSPPP